MPRTSRRLTRSSDLSPSLLRSFGGARDCAVDAGMLALASLAAFWPALQNGFVNWDDPTVLVDNPHLGSAGVAAWAFSTNLIGHYQPIAWLAWSAVKSMAGLSPAAFHALSLTVHAANGILVYAVIRRLGSETALTEMQRRFAALTAGAIFLLHPASVETVAWASAFPYVLSLFALLLSLLAYVNARLLVSIAFFALSLLTRAAAIGFPAVLLIADLYPLRRHRRTPITRLMLEKMPFAVLAAAAAAAEWQSREVVSLQEVGFLPRLTMALAAPLLYVGRTLWPVRLSPLHPLPIAPAGDLQQLLLAAAGILALTLAAWVLRRRWPAIAASWAAYLILIAPVAGLTPTGLQATADRYMYVPSVVVALVAGGAIARALTPGALGITAAALTTAALVACGALARQQATYWKDSIALWTRVLEIDARNDIASYNLASALAEAGRSGEAIAAYERTIALVPDHDAARQNLALLQAAEAERHADRLAAAGQAREAIDEYTRALALDAKRAHARAARAILTMRRGQLREAAVDLRRALDEGVTDVEASNALAFALTQTGDDAQAVEVLTRGTETHPDNINLKHNLARLLATASDPRVRDGARAVRLALEVCDQTGNRDPRALDTLAAAYAADGRLDLARAAAARAEARARELGDAATADEIAAHAKRLSQARPTDGR
jgi:protein O-mannosyl-transferase